MVCVMLIVYRVIASKINFLNAYFVQKNKVMVKATTAKGIDLSQCDWLLIKLNFVESVIEHVYKVNGFNFNPFDIDHKASMINDCGKDLYFFFLHILKSSRSAHKALQVLKKSSGNLFLFYLLLDNELQNKIMDFNMFDYTRILKDKELDNSDAGW